MKSETTRRPKSKNWRDVINFHGWSPYFVCEMSISHIYILRSLQVHELEWDNIEISNCLFLCFISTCHCSSLSRLTNFCLSIPSLCKLLQIHRNSRMSSNFNFLQPTHGFIENNRVKNHFIDLCLSIYETFKLILQGEEKKNLHSSLMGIYLSLLINHIHKWQVL